MEVAPRLEGRRGVAGRVRLLLRRTVVDDGLRWADAVETSGGSRRGGGWREGDDMPGPVSDSYDPEFGTGINAHDVQSGMQGVVDEIGSILGPGPGNIIEVARGDGGPRFVTHFSERELRLIRFGLLRAMESV